MLKKNEYRACEGEEDDVTAEVEELERRVVCLQKAKLSNVASNEEKSSSSSEISYGRDLLEKPAHSGPALSLSRLEEIEEHNGVVFQAAKDIFTLPSEYRSTESGSLAPVLFAFALLEPEKCVISRGKLDLPDSADFQAVKSSIYRSGQIERDLLIHDINASKRFEAYYDIALRFRAENPIRSQWESFVNRLDFIGREVIKRVSDLVTRSPGLFTKTAPPAAKATAPPHLRTVSHQQHTLDNEKHSANNGPGR